MAFIPRQEITIRKGPLYFIAAVFIGFLLILYQEKKINDGASLAAAIGLLVFIAVYYMLSKTKLIVENDGITQQLFFGKQKVIRWEDVAISTLSWHYHGHGSNLEWTIQPFSGKNISIQPAFYSRKNLQLIADALVEKCAGAKLEKRILQMAKGKFPWYIF